MRHRCFPKIEMSFWFFLGLSLFLLFDQGNLGSMCVAAVLLHELGHIAAMTLLGVKIQRIRLTPFGIDLERGEAGSIRSELMIHLSGPFTNLCLAVLLAGMTVSAIIIIITISNSINNQRIRAEQMAESAITETQPVAIGYYLKEYNGELAVFRGNSDTPFKMLGVSINVMTDYDKKLLSDGIFAEDEIKLATLIEDYTS